MNLFQKYGIKDVADVTFYSIYHIGKEEYYVPVLYLDTLRVSSIEQKVEKSEYKGAKGNSRLITWNYGRDITLKLEDALFTPASMSMTVGGSLQQTLSPYITAILKIITANKYGKRNYSTKAFPSPEITKKEWEIIYDAMNIYSSKIMHEDEVIFTSPEYEENHDVPFIEQRRVYLRQMYYRRQWEYSKLYSDSRNSDVYALPADLIAIIGNMIKNIRQIGELDTATNEITCIDRFEKYVVTDRYGLTISKKSQIENHLKYLNNDKVNYVVYYDPATMLPFFNLNDYGDMVGYLNEKAYDFNINETTDQDIFVLKEGAIYYKLTRTVLTKQQSANSTLGKEFLIDAETFPGEYKIVGETSVRSQKTGKDEHYQFIINNAKISPNVSIALKADGDMSSFNMDVYALCKDDKKPMLEMRAYETEDDYLHGGQHLIPQKDFYKHTKVSIPFVTDIVIENNEIY